jgi:uncharacterized protein
MFILVLTLVATLLHAYLFWHIAALPWLQLGWAYRAVWLVALLLWLLFVTGAFYGHDGSGGVAAWFERLAMDWLGVLFIGSVVMLGVDLLSIAGIWCHQCLPWLRSGGLVLTVVLVAFALYQGGRTPVVVQQEVTLRGLPQELDGTRIVALSDLHLGSQLGAEWMQARVEQVMALKPDLILLLGDNFEGHDKPDPALEPVFARLKAPLGVYAVTGNHEHFGDYHAAMALTAQAGVHWLRNRWVELRPGLVLAGVDDLTIHWRRGETGTEVARVLADHPREATILLSHSPLQVREAAAAGVGLMLSGHTHGGQIWPFGYLVQRFYPWLEGRHEVDGMSLIISRGTGLWGPRMRLWKPGEILLLRLRTA